MNKEKKTRLLLLSGVLIIIILFIFYGPPNLISKTSSPEFCSSCHVMEYQHEDWFMTGLHRSVKCTECHLPNNNALNHLLWKGIDGMKDVVYFYGRIYSDNIEITDHGRNTIRKNCQRCHKEMVSRILDTERNCWECHRRVRHKYPRISFMQ